MHTSLLKELHIFFFLYVNTRKYWFRENFRPPVLDKFTRFGMSLTRFDYFWKKCFCLCECDKNVMAGITGELMHRIS